MKKEIAEILKVLRDKEIGEIVDYDIKDWWIPGEDNSEDPYHIKKIMHYYTAAEKDGEIRDCDVELFSMVVYYLSFLKDWSNWEIDKQPRGKNGHEKCKCRLVRKGALVTWELRGDTMNSYATTVREYIRRIWIPEDNHKTYMEEHGMICKKGRSICPCSELDRNRWEDVILRNYDYFQNVFPASAQEYIRLNHTIGNFIPVPFVRRGGQFNSPRGMGSSKDFWDLALLAIYNYYHGDFCLKEYPSFALRWLLGETTNVGLCQNWLNFYDGETGEEKWDTFVEQNFMQDFVEEKKEHYGMPIPLWEDHFMGAVMPQNKREYDQFFKEASARIKKRGERIAKKIKTELENKDISAIAKKMVNNERNK